MKGEVQVLVAFKPDRVFFRQVAKGATQSEVISLEGEKAAQAKLSEPASSKPEFKAVLTELEGKQALKVSFTAPAKEGRHSAQVTVKTGLDKPEQLTVHVMAQVTGDLVPDRNYAVFAPYKADNPPKFAIQVKSLSKKPFKIKKVFDPSGAVTGKASQKDGVWSVELTLAKPSGTPRGKIQLHTDRADQPQLLVNYTVRGSNQRMPPGVRNVGGPTGKVKPTLIPSGAGGKGTPIRLQLNPGTRKMQRPLQPAPSTRSSTTTQPKP